MRERMEGAERGRVVRGREGGRARKRQINRESGVGEREVDGEGVGGMEGG